MPSFRKSTATSLALLSLALQNASGFVPSSLTPSVASTTSSTKSNSIVANLLESRSLETKIASTIEDLTEDIYQSYGEESRTYRRTVYTHEDWVKHRSSNRFFRNLLSFANSGIYKSLFKEVLTTTSVAAFIVVWNMLFGEYQDFQSVTHNGPFHDSVIPILALPLAPFTLASPALGLLLGE
jgi:hypothetical protein